MTTFDTVIPTGWLTAYGRALSDIPYARQVFDELESVKSGDSADMLTEMKNAKLAAKFEARYKLIDQIIRRSNATQIIEFASGLSTRGLAATTNSAVTYVELDLPLMMADKRIIFARLERRGTYAPRPNLHLTDGNALNATDIRAAIRPFDHNKPLCIITEGLLRYLTLDEQRDHAMIVLQLLKEYGGVWITPDISFIDTTHGEAGVTSARRKKIARLTGKNVSENRFQDLAHAVEFFKGIGFTIASHDVSAVMDQLVVPEKLGLSKEYVAQTIEGAVVFEMRRKPLA